MYSPIRYSIYFYCFSNNSTKISLPITAPIRTPRNESENSEMSNKKYSIYEPNVFEITRQRTAERSRSAA